MKVTIFGAGLMGQSIAQRLIEKGWEVNMWNRTYEKMLDLKKKGVRIFRSPVEAGKASDLWVTFLSDGSATLSLWNKEDGLEHAIQENGVWIQMGTLSYDDTMKCVALSQKFGIAFCDAPVLGSTGEARRGELLVLFGGSEKVYEHVHTFFDDIGKRTIKAGPVGYGTLLKLTTNLLLAHMMVGLAEWYVFGTQVGLNALAMWEVIKNSKLYTPMFEAKFMKLFKEDFQPSFPFKWMRKDLYAVLESAHRFGAWVPGAGMMKMLYDAGMHHGLGEDDYSAIEQVLAMLSQGFEGERPPTLSTSGSESPHSEES